MSYRKEPVRQPGTVGRENGQGIRGTARGNDRQWWCHGGKCPLRLTTQVPVKQVFLTSGRSRTLKLGRQEIELRHAPPWQLVLGNRKAGGAVRALAWVGRERAELAVEKIRRSLTAEERRELRSVSAQMLGWLVGPVSSLDYG